LPKAKKGRGRFSTISLPTPLVELVEKVVDNLKYWPTKTDFIREAVLEKLMRYESKLEVKEPVEKE